MLLKTALSLQTQSLNSVLMKKASLFSATKFLLLTQVASGMQLNTRLARLRRATTNSSCATGSRRTTLTATQASSAFRKTSWRKHQTFNTSARQKSAENKQNAARKKRTAL